MLFVFLLRNFNLIGAGPLDPNGCLIVPVPCDFWDSFIIVLSGIPKQESIFIGSDMNGHVGRDSDGYGGVHGGMGFGTSNAEGERILEFGDAVGMVVCNTFFKRRL